MTTTQITKILDDCGLSANTWLQLEKYIPLIILSEEANLQPDDKKAVYRFNNTQELLEVVFGSYINKTFTTDSGETNPNNFIPDHFISYSIIAGLSENAKTYSGGIYHTIPFK